MTGRRHTGACLRRLVRFIGSRFRGKRRLKDWKELVEIGLKPGGTLVKVSEVAVPGYCNLVPADLHKCPSPKDRPAMVFVMPEGERHVRVMTYQVPLVGKMLEAVQEIQ